MIAALLLAAAPWPDTFVARLNALAQVESLNAELLSHDSATATLQAWCDVYGVVPGTRIRALRGSGEQKSADPSVRADLHAGPGELIAYRHVQLTCGDVVLSQADNWYRPERLTPGMNNALENTDTPFGVVVRTLNFHRRTLAADVLFLPLPRGWEAKSWPQRQTTRPLQVPAEILRHRAVLTAADGEPFSLVSETYSRAVLIRPKGR